MGERGKTQFKPVDICQSHLLVGLVGIVTPMLCLEGHCWSEAQCPYQTVVVTGWAGAAGAVLRTRELSKFQGTGGKLEEDIKGSYCVMG